MNGEPETGAPSTAEDDGEPITDLLADCDERIAAGDSLDHAPHAGLDPELSPKLKRGLDCLRRLDKLRPGRGDEDSSGAPGFGLGQRPDSSWRHGHPTRVGRFQVRRKLGHGGFGVVYLAHDPQLRRLVALKIPHPRTLLTAELRERFELEAEAAARLDHRNIVQVYESGSAGPLHYIAAAYCPGISLAAWLRDRREPVPARSAAQLVAQLADGVRHAHERGVLHRDLKPGNVLLTPTRDGRSLDDTRDVEFGSTLDGDAADFLPRIADFGMAKRVGEWESDDAEDDPSAPLTKTGAVMGTPSYMAPEQAAGRSKEVGKATDVHALGVILYEMLTGRTPYLAESTYDTLRRVQHDEPLPPRRLRPKLPRDLETICLKCLQKEPRRRYASAGDLADDLRRFLDGKTIEARSVGPIERAWRWGAREPLVAGLLAALAAVIVTAIAGLTHLWFDASKKAKIAIDERNAAIAARLTAEQFLGHARTLVGELSDVAGRISNAPALAKTRRELVEKLLDFHENFLLEKPRDPGVLYSAATAYFAAARVRADVGRDDEAIQAHDRAGALFDQLIAIEPNNPLHLEKRSANDFWSAKHYELRAKDYPKAIAAYDEAVASMSGLRTAYPHYAPYAGQLAVQLVNRALTLRRLDRQDDADADVEQALALGRRMARITPDDAWTRLNLALFLDARGEVEIRHGRLDRAVQLSVESVEILRKLAAEPDAPAQTPWYLGRFLATLSTRQARAGRTAERDEALREAREVSTKLLDLHPQVVDYRLSLARIERQTAHDAAAAGRPTEALAAWGRAIAHYGILHDGAPREAEFSNILAEAHVARAQILISTDPRAAVAEYEAAAVAKPEDPGVRNDHAWLLLTADDPSVRDPAKALRLAREAAAGSASAEHLNTLGVALHRAGDHPAALDALERAAKLRKRPDPSDEVFLAMTLRRLGRDDEARQRYKKFLDLLARSKPKPGSEDDRFRAEAEALFGKPDAPKP